MPQNLSTDFLTGFLLRESLYPTLEQLILEANASKKHFSLALLDLDRFKKFNDKFGHHFGDEILKYASSTLRLSLGETGCYLFRYGGDEFIAVFPDHKAQEAARLMRQCNYNLMRRPFLFKNKFYKVTFSCGVAGFPADAKAIDDLIARADKAMYFSKRHGRGFVTVSSRIPFLKLRALSLQAASVAMMGLSVLIAYRLTFNKVIDPFMGKVQHARIIMKPAALDMVVLKNGDTYEGTIVEESPQRVILSLYMEKGEGTVVFSRSEISSIRYGREKQQ